MPPAGNEVENCINNWLESQAKFTLSNTGSSIPNCKYTYFQEGRRTRSYTQTLTIIQSFREPDARERPMQQCEYCTLYSSIHELHNASPHSQYWFHLQEKSCLTMSHQCPTPRVAARYFMHWVRYWHSWLLMKVLGPLCQGLSKRKRSVDGCCVLRAARSPVEASLKGDLGRLE